MKMINNFQFNIPGQRSGAYFSECGKYRYALWRQWANGKRVVAFVGLNPSTADHLLDDPTIRRCIRFSQDWGFDGLVMLNIFGWRATDPKELKAVSDPIGALNKNAFLNMDDWLDAPINDVVCAWGAHGKLHGRGSIVTGWLTGEDHKHRKIFCLGKTKSGSPKHPLYLRATTTCEDYP